MPAVSQRECLEVILMIDTTIACRIRSARLQAHMTQGELAAKAHWASRSIQNWELGKRMPSVEAISTLAETLHCDPAWLAGWKE